MRIPPGSHGRVNYPPPFAQASPPLAQAPRGVVAQERGGGVGFTVQIKNLKKNFGILSGGDITAAENVEFFSNLVSCV